MSYILDALRKADAQRVRDRAQVVGGSELASSQQALANALRLLDIKAPEVM